MMIYFFDKLIFSSYNIFIYLYNSFDLYYFVPSLIFWICLFNLKKVYIFIKGYPFFINLFIILLFIIIYYKYFGKVIYAAGVEDKDIVEKAKYVIKDLPKPEIKGDVNNNFNVGSANFNVPKDALPNAGLSAAVVGGMSAMATVAKNSSMPWPAKVGLIAGGGVLGSLITLGSYSLNDLRSDNNNSNGSSNGSSLNNSSNNNNNNNNFDNITNNKDVDKRSILEDNNYLDLNNYLDYIKDIDIIKIYNIYFNNIVSNINDLINHYLF